MQSSNFAGTSSAAEPHTHDWFECYRRPAGDWGFSAIVADCGCGVRALIFPGPSGLPEIRVETVQPGGSIANCLVRDNESALGDPQAERLRLLTT